jgi:hypothetical protein
MVPGVALGLPRKMNPGAHEVRARAAGHAPVLQLVTLVEGTVTTAKLTLAPEAAAVPSAVAARPSSTLVAPLAPPSEAGSRGAVPTYAWVALGVGAAGLVLGGVTGAMTLARASDAKPGCTNGTCPGKAGEDLDAAKTLANVSNVGFGVALVGGAIGLYGLLARAPAPAPVAARLEPWFTPTGAGLSGRF